MIPKEIKYNLHNDDVQGAPLGGASTEYPQHVCFHGEIRKISILFGCEKVPWLDDVRRNHCSNGLYSN